MKIKYDVIGTKKFRDVKIGETFLFTDHSYGESVGLRINEIIFNIGGRITGINTVNLSTNNVSTVYNSEEVKILNVQ